MNLPTQMNLPGVDVDVSALIARVQRCAGAGRPSTDVFATSGGPTAVDMAGDHRCLTSPVPVAMRVFSAQWQLMQLIAVKALPPALLL